MNELVLCVYKMQLNSVQNKVIEIQILVCSECAIQSLGHGAESSGVGKRSVRSLCCDVK